MQDAQRQKELVVIGNQREVEVARQVAERETIEQRKLQDLAVIQKDKELSIAKAELDISKANAVRQPHSSSLLLSLVSLSRSRFDCDPGRSACLNCSTHQLLDTPHTLHTSQLAAKFQAEAIAAKGKAEADVLKLNYQAKAQNKEIFLAETQRDMAVALYGNLKDFKVEMPQNVIMGGGGGGAAGKLPSNLDVITGFSALGLMEKALQSKASAHA